MKLLSLTTIVATLFTSVLARSSVYMVSNANTQQQTETQPEVSMNTFSMFYSHMMDTSRIHPAFYLQDAATQQQVQDVVNIFSPKTDNLFNKKLNANLMVIVSGVQAPQDVLSNYDVSFFVSDDNSQDYTELVENTFNEMNHHQDMIITTYKDQETEIKQGDEAVLFDNFKMEYKDLDTSVFDINNEADKMFMTQVQDVQNIFYATETTTATMIEINSLQKLAQEYGFDSKQYKEAHKILGQLFEKHIIPKFHSSFVEKKSMATFILTPPSPSPNHTKTTKRDMDNRKLAINQAVCYNTIAACINGTSNCSQGNGQCVNQGDNDKQTCWSCQCNSSHYVGENCQYINAVADFQLLFWTGVLLIVITSSVIVCVYQSGNMVDGGIIMTQSLPKQE